MSSQGCDVVGPCVLRWSPPIDENLLARETSPEARSHCQHRTSYRGDEKGWTDWLLRSETSQKGLLADRELSEEVDEFDHEVELLSE